MWVSLFIKLWGVGWSPGVFRWLKGAGSWGTILQCSTRSYCKYSDAVNAPQRGEDEARGQEASRRRRRRYLRDDSRKPWRGGSEAVIKEAWVCLSRSVIRKTLQRWLIKSKSRGRTVTAGDQMEAAVENSVRAFTEGGGSGGGVQFIHCNCESLHSWTNLTWALIQTWSQSGYMRSEIWFLKVSDRKQKNVFKPRHLRESASSSLNVSFFSVFHVTQNSKYCSTLWQSAASKDYSHYQLIWLFSR